MSLSKSNGNAPPSSRPFLVTAAVFRVQIMFRVPTQRAVEMAVSSPLIPFSLSLVSQQLWSRNDQGSMPRIMGQEQVLEMGSAGREQEGAEEREAWLTWGPALLPSAMTH